VSEQIDITINKVAAYKIVGIQLILTVILTAILSVYISQESAYSALLGGFIFILPNAYFVRCAFRGKGQQSPDSVLRWFYMGEAGKLILTGVLFAACFVLVKPLNVPALFGVYILMMIINLVGLARIKN